MTEYKKVKLTKEQRHCPGCSGRGKIYDCIAEDNMPIIDCPTCKGKGWLNRKTLSKRQG